MQTASNAAAHPLASRDAAAPVGSLSAPATTAAADPWQTLEQTADALPRQVKQQVTRHLERALVQGPEKVAESARQEIHDEARQTAETVSSAAGFDIHWPSRDDLLNQCRQMDSILAAVLLFVGIAYGLFGYTLFKLATTLNIAALGAWAGWWVGRQFDATIPGMAVGAVLAAAIAWPAMRYTVAFCGALIGFMIGVAVWRALGLLDLYAPAGGLIGAIFLCMFSFILFRPSIMIFTAVQGVAMFIAGLLGLFLKYPGVEDPITQHLGDQPVILPIVLFVLSVIGLLFQQHWHKDTSKSKGSGVTVLKPA